VIRLPYGPAGSTPLREIIVSPSKIIALGMNYRDHIAENSTLQVRGFDGQVPTEPVLFPKTPNVLVGPGEPIVIPAFLRQYNFPEPRVDYEAELAVLVADRCKDVPVEQVWEHILGFTCFNDVSQRNIQNSDRGGWFRGKSFDTFGPIGPRVVPLAAIGDPQDLAIRCRLNGRVVQDSSTRYMIFSVAETFAFISRNFTLEEGDIIATGTPSGVGPLRHGDVVEVEVDGIGFLRNPVVEESLA
jgi:2-keto-4-pentenoate hydratase/2-oxohepta-3-ene-1,7-dioic acid hydratase in catechol pathway